MLDACERHEASGREMGRTASGIGATLLAMSLVIPAVCCSLGTSARAAESLPTVTIGKAVDTIPVSALDVGIAEGLFKKNGVNVKEILVQGSSAASAAMVGGSLQFGFESAFALILARSHGVPLISIAALDDIETLQFVISKQWFAKHPTPADATLKQKMSSLNGSVLGQVGATDSAFYGLVRGWAGLPKQEGYRIESMDSQAAAAAAIQRGMVDVLVSSPPRGIQLVQAGDAVDFVDPRNVPQFNNVANDILVTTSSYANQHPQIAKNVATAIAEALNFMRDHPNQTLAIEQKHFPTLDKEVLRKSLQFVPFSKNALQSKEAWNRTVQLAQQTGVVKGVESAPEGVYWTNKYIDLSKLKK